MFILAVIDNHTERQSIADLLEPLHAQINFVKSDENLSELCQNTEPDAILLKAHYEEVSAKYILNHFDPNFYDALPERIVVLSKQSEIIPEMVLSATTTATWVLEKYIVAALKGEMIDSTDLSSYESLPTPKILHITDDRLLQCIVSDLIHKQTNYRIETASNGSKGLEIYHSFHPNLVLTDWDLPDIDGIELCRRIKIEFADTFTQVALFSSMTDEHLIEEAYKVKAKAYIVKPVNPDLLLSKIRKIIDNSEHK